MDIHWIVGRSGLLYGGLPAAQAQPAQSDNDLDVVMDGPARGASEFMKSLYLGDGTLQSMPRIPQMTLRFVVLEVPENAETDQQAVQGIVDTVKAAIDMMDFHAPGAHVDVIVEYVVANRVHTDSSINGEFPLEGLFHETVIAGLKSEAGFRVRLSVYWRVHNTGDFHLIVHRLHERTDVTILDIDSAPDNSQHLNNVLLRGRDHAFWSYYEARARLSCSPVLV